MKKNKFFYILVSYTFLIYITNPFGRTILKIFYNNIGHNNFKEIIHIVAIFFIIFLFILFLKNKSFKENLIFLILTLILFIFVFSTNIPEERIHYIEYTILGVLTFKTFQKDSFKNFVFYSLLILLIGAVDETIQFFLPNRVGDLRDVWMNFIGGLIGLCYGKILF